MMVVSPLSSQVLTTDDVILGTFGKFLPQLPGIRILGYSVWIITTSSRMRRVLLETTYVGFIPTV